MTDFKSCPAAVEKGYPTEWPKIAQISPTEFILTGGATEDVAQSCCFKLNTENHSLVAISDLPSPRLAHQVCYAEHLGKNIGEGVNRVQKVESYVFLLAGKEEDNGVESKKVFKYSIENDTWQTVSSMCIATISINVVHMGRFLYCFDQKNNQYTIQKYSLETDRWKLLNTPSFGFTY